MDSFLMEINKLQEEKKKLESELDSAKSDEENIRLDNKKSFETKEDLDEKIEELDRNIEKLSHPAKFITKSIIGNLISIVAVLGGSCGVGYALLTNMGELGAISQLIPFGIPALFIIPLIMDSLASDIKLVKNNTLADTVIKKRSLEEEKEELVHTIEKRIPKKLQECQMNEFEIRARIDTISKKIADLYKEREEALETLFRDNYIEEEINKIYEEQNSETLKREIK